MPYTESNVEAALCVWEDLLARTSGDLSGDDPGLDAFLHANGTVVLRQHAVSLGVWVDQAYGLMNEDVRDAVPFDWEIVPALMDLVEWRADGYSTPLPAEAAEIVGKHFQ